MNGSIIWCGGGRGLGTTSCKGVYGEAKFRHGQSYKVVSRFWIRWNSSLIDWKLKSQVINAKWFVGLIESFLFLNVDIVCSSADYDREPSESQP